ncbi:tRNA U34 5-methylaminomethyl-2-thiouridine-forming methyltransferase MnmC [Parabacteroides sp. PFB2-10]|uniref:tRNA (5-methylaminomethyl-2-thiouridine)(34)-methyltransferase MnmD n=1 Tax=Parabacteroides sp. PFB2-10 TaxID=1742405 RepID=UPI002474B8E5|nr:tRNA (5-methylaminomethyl-2-thiouridine)(34)-methyltransferase MnmD [Parabacteroides sp. PFB2-10]MDH6312210.1 tRNA U34 5-methylaminomethyl-2-thiouridine-forming methyltransferase MnmC [Parabacteroides sp. PFB2-10]
MIPQERILTKTEDGSHTLFIPSMNEHYHSTKGAIQESTHVFIQAGWQAMPQQRIRILEIGFGTGLNAFLTLCEADKSEKEIDYYAIERFPLEESLIEELNYANAVAPQKKDLFISLHRAHWGEAVAITDRFSLYKMEGDINSCQLPEGIDLIFFDAFAPEKQPEMWNLPLFEKLYASASPGAIFVTYCAKGEVRRNLQTAGFQMERLPGPPGKRHMLRGKKP